MGRHEGRTAPRRPAKSSLVSGCIATMAYFNSRNSVYNFINLWLLLVFPCPWGNRQKAAKQEWRLAASRHYFIAQAISRCYTEIDLTVSTLPDKAITTSPIINAAFLLGLQPNGTYEFGSGSSGAPPGFKPLSSYHNALIHLTARC